MRLEFLRRMQRELELTAGQREQMDRILKQSQERTRKLMEPVAPQLHQELQRAKAEFREALTSAQQARFDELVKQQQRFNDQHRRDQLDLTRRGLIPIARAVAQKRPKLSLLKPSLKEGLEIFNWLASGRTSAKVF
jgi:hypothetical protein